MDDCQHEPMDVESPSWRHDEPSRSVIVEDDLDPSYPCLPTPTSARIVPCKHCGAPLQLPRDDRYAVHRSWAIERLGVDPLAKADQGT